MGAAWEVSRELAKELGFSGRESVSPGLTYAYSRFTGTSGWKVNQKATPRS